MRDVAVCGEDFAPTRTLVMAAENSRLRSVSKALSPVGRGLGEGSSYDKSHHPHPTSTNGSASPHRVFVSLSLKGEGKFHRYLICSSTSPAGRVDGASAPAGWGYTQPSAPPESVVVAFFDPHPRPLPTKGRRVFRAGGNRPLPPCGGGTGRGVNPTTFASIAWSWSSTQMIVHPRGLSSVILLPPPTPPREADGRYCHAPEVGQ